MPAGRHLALTPDVQDTICYHIGRGATFRRAAEAAGVSETSFFRWMEKGEKDDHADPVYAAFASAVREAEAKAAIALSDVVFETAVEKRDADVALKMLKARFPNEYGERSVNVRHTGPGGGPIMHELTAEAKLDALVAQLTPELLDGLLQRLLTGGVEPALPRLTEVDGAEEIAGVHQVHLPGLSADAPSPQTRGDAGEGGEWGDQAADYLDATSAREESPR